MQRRLQTLGESNHDCRRAPFTNLDGVAIEMDSMPSTCDASVASVGSSTCDLASSSGGSTLCCKSYLDISCLDRSLATEADSMADSMASTRISTMDLDLLISPESIESRREGFDELSLETTSPSSVKAHAAASSQWCWNGAAASSLPSPPPPPSRRHSDVCGAARYRTFRHQRAVATSVSAASIGFPSSSWPVADFVRPLPSERLLRSPLTRSRASTTLCPIGIAGHNAMALG